MSFSHRSFNFEGPFGLAFRTNFRGEKVEAEPNGLIFAVDYPKAAASANAIFAAG